jgi:hypothetical protein
MARAWIREASPDWEARLAACFEVAPGAEPTSGPELIVERFG